MTEPKTLAAVFEPNEEERVRLGLCCTLDHLFERRRDLMTAWAAFAFGTDTNSES